MNHYTQYFDEPVPKESFVRLLHCSLFNSRVNLKRDGQISLFDLSGVTSPTTVSAGLYTLEKWHKNWKSFQKRDLKSTTELNTPVGEMVIKNLEGTKIPLDSDLAKFLGISRDLKTITSVKRLKTPSTYFVHCDFIDPERNSMNGKPSTLVYIVRYQRESV